MSGLFVKVPRHEFIDACCGMPCCNGFERCLEIGVWLDFVELAGLNQGGDATPCSAAFVMAREQRVFSIEGNGADSALYDVAVHLDGAILKE